MGFNSGFKGLISIYVLVCNWLSWGCQAEWFSPRCCCCWVTTHSPRFVELCYTLYSSVIIYSCWSRNSPYDTHSMHVNKLDWIGLSIYSGTNKRA